MFETGSEAVPGKIFDAIVIGAGPTGLACAIELHRAGLDYLVIEKGAIVNSLFNYPSHMTFFTTPELIEIGDLPMVSSREKPTRAEALKYYRRVVQTYGLRVNQYERVVKISGSDGEFVIDTVSKDDSQHRYLARKLVIATGYFDNPNYLGIPGEDLLKVSHYYNDPHPYFDQDVVVIGAANSACIAALELYRSGARTTIVHRGPDVGKGVKYWIRPDILNRIKNGEVTAHFNSVITDIRPTGVTIRELLTGECFDLRNDFVFALTGYHTDYDFLRSFGIDVQGETHIPAHDPDTLESNVPGIYLAGVVIAGDENSNVFIENGRFHGKQIIIALKRALERRDSLVDSLAH